MRKKEEKKRLKEKKNKKRWSVGWSEEEERTRSEGELSESGLPSPPSPRSSVASDRRRCFPFRAARSPRGGCILKTTSCFFFFPRSCVTKQQTREMKNNAPFCGEFLRPRRRLRFELSGKPRGRVGAWCIFNSVPRTLGLGALHSFHNP